MTVHLTEQRLAWKWVWDDWEQSREWIHLHSPAWLDGRCTVIFCSLWLLGSIWTMWLGYFFLSPRLLFLRVFHGPFTLCMILVTFCLAPWAMVKDALCRHAGKCLTYVAHKCNPIVYLPEVDGNCFCIPTYLKTPRAEWLPPQTGRNIRVPESVAQKQSLKADHGTGHALFILSVVACMVLL